MADGVSVYLLRTSSALRRLGVHVTLVADDAYSCDALKRAHQDLAFAVVGGGRFPLLPLRRLIRAEQPDVIHLHGSWRPRHALVSLVAFRMGIAVIQSPHGGLAPSVLRSGRPKRDVYSALLERPIYRRAAGFTALSLGERSEIDSYAGRPEADIVVTNPPDDAFNYRRWAWENPGGRLSAVFIGRLHVWHKGIDRLIEIARRTPEVDIRLFGPLDPTTKDEIDKLRRSAPANVTFEGPIFGEDKLRVLAGATVFLQPSRFEGFSLALVEALMVGVPVMMSPSLTVAPELLDRGVVLMLPDDPDAAAASVRSAANDAELLTRTSALAREFAEAHCSSDAVAQQLLDLYTRVLAPMRARNEAMVSVR